MEITQTSIKINQTNQIEGATSGSNKQSDQDYNNAFDQILAMFVALGQLAPITGQPISSDVQIGNKREISDSNNLKSLSENRILMNSSTKTKQDVNLILTNFLQGLQGLDQISPSDPTQQQQELKLLISDLQSHGYLSGIENLEGLLKEFPTTSNQLNAGLETELKSLFNLSEFKDTDLSFDTVLNDNESSYVEKKHEQAMEAKPLLSLNKDEVLLSSFSNLKSNITEEDLIPDSITSFEAGLTESSELAFSLEPKVQNTGRYGQQGPESPVPTLTVSEFAPEVSEWIGRNIRLSSGQSGNTEAKFSLFPEHLGHIEIKISSQQGQVSAQILTDTSLAKEALESQLPHLRQALQHQGIIVQKLDIVQQQSQMETNTLNLSFSQGGFTSSQEQRTFSFNQNTSNKQKEFVHQDTEVEPVVNTYGRTSPFSASNIDFTA